MFCITDWRLLPCTNHKASPHLKIRISRGIVGLLHSDSQYYYAIFPQMYPYTFYIFELIFHPAQSARFHSNYLCSHRQCTEIPYNNPDIYIPFLTLFHTLLSTIFLFTPPHPMLSYLHISPHLYPRCQAIFGNLYVWFQAS